MSTKWLVMDYLVMMILLAGSTNSFYIQSATTAAIHHGTYLNHVNIINIIKSTNRRNCYERLNHCSLHQKRVRVNSNVMKLNDMSFPGTAEALAPSPSSLPSLPAPKTIHSFWSQPHTREEIKRHCAQTVFSKEQYTHTRKRINVISSDLPLITIDNFLSHEFCNDIIDTAINSSIGMKPSTMGVSQQISKSRTSSTLWLHDNGNDNDENNNNNDNNDKSNKALRVLAGKVSQLVGLHTSHMENLQVVKYEQGQKFDLHTDHLDSFNELDCRGRLATCLLYLNSSSDNNDNDDDSEGEFRGGCTYFPEYEAYVMPKKGRAVFWFNTIEKPGSVGYTHDMNLTVDLRSRHAGTPVYNGVKWVCNRWIHPIPLGFGVRGDAAAADDDDWCD